MLALELLRGPDGIDTVCTAQEFHDPRKVDLRRVRVTSVPHDSLHAVEGPLVCPTTKSRESSSVGLGNCR